MKKLLSVICIFALLFTLSLPLSMTAYAADSPEILVNPDFEAELEGWAPHVVSTLTLIEEDTQAGDYACYAEDKFSSNDGPYQDITEKINFYGKGKYSVSAYVKLDTAETAQAFIAVKTQSSDTTYGSGGLNWFTGNTVTVNNSTWTKLEGIIDIDWSDTLEFCEFYFIINPEDAGLEPSYFDTCSMKKLDYTGEEFPTVSPEPSPAPTPILTPTPVPTPTVAITPTAVLAVSTPTATAEIADKGDFDVMPFLLFGGAILAAAAGTIIWKKNKNNTPKDTPEQK